MFIGFNILCSIGYQNIGKNSYCSRWKLQMILKIFDLKKGIGIEWSDT